MKKSLCVLVLALVLVTFAACNKGGGKGDATAVMADGAYTAVMDDAYAAGTNHGWRDELTVVYKDGKVVSATVDSINVETGEKKSEADSESYPMPVSPGEWMPALAGNIVAAGTSSKLDAVSGATSTSGSVKQLWAAIETQGKPGETIVVTFK